MKRLLLLLLFLSGCAHAPSGPITIHHFECRREFPDVAEELRPYFWSFEENIGVKTTGITAGFKTLKQPEVGDCHFSLDDRSLREISIDPAYWATAPDSDREQLIEHELGHCSLELGHDDTKDGDDVPLSIMSPNLLPTDDYRANRAYYIFELKSKKRPHIMEDLDGMDELDSKKALDKHLE